MYRKKPILFKLVCVFVLPPDSCVNSLLLVKIPLNCVIQINPFFLGSSGIIRNIRIIKESTMNKVQFGLVYGV